MEKNEPSPYAQRLKQMLGERGAYDGETDAYAVLYRIALDLLTECSALRATEDNLRAQIGQGEPDELRMRILLARYENQWHRMGELWERCQGKGWPEAESKEFARLRDELTPATRALLLASTPPATQAEHAPSGSGGWEARARALERELAYWKKRAKTMHLHQKGECWYWHGDGNDNPESMVNSLPVVIRADALRGLIAPQQKPLTDEQITAGAKALCKRSSEICGVNADDNWNLESEYFKDDARCVLEAAHNIGEKK